MPRKSKHPRIEPLQPPYDDETAAALELLGPPIQLFRVFARRPELARGIAGWGHYYLSRRSALSLRHRELVIDRATARCGADYEWGVHIAVLAEKAGLSEDQVRSLATGSDADPCWLDPRDRAVHSFGGRVARLPRPLRRRVVGPGRRHRRGRRI